VLLVIAPDGSLAMRNEKPAVLIEAKGPQAHAELARELTDRRGLLVLLSIHGLALPFADDGKAYRCSATGAYDAVALSCAPCRL